MKKLRFIGLLVAVALLAFGLAVACSSDTPKDDDPFLKVYTGTSSSGQPVEITISSSSIARATEPQTGHNYLAKVNNAVTSEGKIRREAAGVIVFIPNDKSKPEFSGSWNNNILSVTNLPGPGGEALTVTAQDKDGGGGSGGGAGGGGGGGSGGGGGGGGGTTTPTVDPTIITSLSLAISPPSGGATATAKGAVDSIAGADGRYTASVFDWGVGTVWGAATVLLGGTLFVEETVYKAKFVLAAVSPNTFDTNVAVRLNGKDIVFDGVTNTKSSTGMNFEVTFPKTLKAVSALTITKEQHKLTYTAGEKIDLTGLEVKLDFVDGSPSKTNITAAQFGDNGITMQLSGTSTALNIGDTATTTAHNAKTIDIKVGDGVYGTVGDRSKTTNNAFAVSLKPLNIVGGTAYVKLGELYQYQGQGVDIFDPTTTISGTAINLAKLFNKVLFTGFPADVLPLDTNLNAANGVGDRVLTDKTATLGEDGVGSITGNILTVTGYGTFKVALTIPAAAAAGAIYGTVTNEVIGTLVVTKGDIVITPKSETDRTNTFATAGGGRSVESLFTFKNKLGCDLTLGTDTAPATFTVQATPPTGFTFSAPNISTTAVGTITGNVSIPATNNKTVLFGSETAVTLGTTTWIVIPTPIVTGTPLTISVAMSAALSAGSTPSNRTFTVTPSTGIATPSGIQAVWTTGTSTTGVTTIATGTAYTVTFTLAPSNATYAFSAGSYTVTGPALTAAVGPLSGVTVERNATTTALTIRGTITTPASW
jgi:hypothetical protein